jgi:hypothetical protein
MIGYNQDVIARSLDAIWGWNLVSGFYRRERPDGPALLDRSGPFLPPISFPWGAPENIMIVSDGLKSEMGHQVSSTRHSARRGLRRSFQLTGILGMERHCDPSEHLR